MGLPRIKSTLQIEINGAIIAHSETGVCVGGGATSSSKVQGWDKSIGCIVVLPPTCCPFFMPNECMCFVGCWHHLYLWYNRRDAEHMHTDSNLHSHIMINAC